MTAALPAPLPSPARELHTPRYLLRRYIALSVLSKYGPAEVLEIGCGRGDLLMRLAQRGWSGCGLEISREAVAVAKARTQTVGTSVSVVSDEGSIAGRSFDVVCAMEVLEHIGDDRNALKRWIQFLRRDGVLVLSVPAHVSKWTAADEFGGHQRRYDRAGLQALLEDCGLRIETFWSYGFPLTEVSWRLRQYAYRRRLAAVNGLSHDDRTVRSSFDSTRRAFGQSLIIPVLEATVYVFHLTQLAFRSTDLGDGYIVACRKA